MIPSSKEINGPRPSPLKIHKDSHQIQKQPTTAAGGAHQPRQHQYPIIIYTHSPKVIHTKAGDFMALVQKLTGLSHPLEEDKEEYNARKTPEQNVKEVKAPLPPLVEEDDTAVDATAAEPDELGFESRTLPAMLNNGFLSEIPLFTPNSADHFFFSPKSLYRFSSSESKTFPEFWSSSDIRTIIIIIIIFTVLAQ